MAIIMREVCFVIIILTVVSGCATVELVEPEHLHGQQFVAGKQAVGHIYAANWGWYLFKYIPVVTGNLDRPGIPRLPKLFTDNVRIDLLVDKVTEEGKSMEEQLFLIYGPGTVRTGFPGRCFFG